MDYQSIKDKYFSLLSDTSTITMTVADAVKMIQLATLTDEEKVQENADEDFLAVNILNYAQCDARLKSMCLQYLAHNQMYTFGDVYNKGAMKLKQVKGIGEIAFNAFREILKEHGFILTPMGTSQKRLLNQTISIKEALNGQLPL